MDKYSTNFTKDGGYIIGRDAIAAIANAVSQFTESKIDINISLADNHNVQSNDIEEILSDSYVLNRQIERIYITSYGDIKVVDRTPVSNNRRATVTISSGRFASIDVSIHGDRTASVSLRGELETIIDGQVQWYSWVVRPLPTAIDTSIFMAACLFFFFVNAFVFLSAVGKESVKDFGWLPFLFVAPEIWLVFFFKKRMFPKMIFNIGKSGDVAQDSKAWRSVIFVAVGLGFVVSVLASWFYDRIK